MNKVVQQITDEYPDAAISNLTEYFIDNDPRSCANQLYKITLDDNNLIIIKNVD